MNLALTLICSSMLAGATQVQTDAVSPCRRIRDACITAEIENGHHNDKSLQNDCIDKILAGGTVPGVTNTEKFIHACQMRRAARQAKLAQGDVD